MVQLRGDRDRSLRVFRYPHQVVHRVGRAQWNSVHVQYTSRLIRIALIDLVAIAVELKRFVHVRAGIDPAVVANTAVPVDDFARCVRGL